MIRPPGDPEPAGCSPQYLERIVERAQTLDERLRDPSPPEGTADTDPLADARFERWRQVAAAGDARTFDRRLRLGGFEPDDVRRRLGLRPWAELPPPGWAETLRQCLQAVAASHETTPQDNRPLDAGEPLPFEDLFLPLIRVARRRLRELSGQRYEWLSESAHASVERGLLRWLTYVAAPALQLELATFRATRSSRLSQLLRSQGAGPATGLYRAFLEGLLGGGLNEFFTEYSALARLVATLIDTWVEAACEVLERLDRDSSDLREIFGITIGPGRVVAVDCHVADRHRGGRSVWILEFAEGPKIVYKPRSLGIDRAYFGLLRWCNGCGFPLPFQLLEVIDRSTHGWVEFVALRACQDPSQACRYFQRAGSLLCLLHVLEATDLHFENIIAAGEQPILIDVETLMQPRLREMETLPQNDDAGALALRRIWESVLRTGLLPRWQQADGTGESRRYDLTGLGAEQELSIRVRRWQNVNTDAMRACSRPARNPHRTNLPTLDGFELPVADHVGELIAGFRSMYRFLMQHHSALLASDGPLAAFRKQEVRFLLRSTRIYGMLQLKSLAPELLRLGIDRSIELDILSRAMMASSTRADLRILLQEEKDALERLDVPTFGAVPESDSLHLDDGRSLGGLFDGASFERVASRLRQLSEEDLEQQIDFIRGSLSSRFVAEVHGFTPVVGEPRPVSERREAGEPETPDDALVQVALGIAGELARRAIRAADGSVTWIAPQYIPGAGCYQLEPLNASLYDGVGGVALFLAAVEKVRPTGEFRSLAEGATLSLRQQWQRSAASGDGGGWGIGGGGGWGSAVYVLTRLSQLLGVPSFLQEAESVATQITTERILADRRFDVLLGSAGAVLGLLALHRASGSRLAREGAVECGRHLLRHRTISDSGHRAWATSTGALLTGFSHGAAGIAYALIRLYQVTGDGRVLDAAEEAFAYERQVFDREERNWPDLRTTSRRGDRRCGCSWCHGAPGCGFARLAALPVLDTEDIRLDLEAALAATQRDEVADPDQLCCGSLGQASFLWTAADRLGQKELREIAMRRVARSVTRAKLRGHFACTPPGVFQPGFFQGLSGIGYELLRLTQPEQLPAALLWE